MTVMRFREKAGLILGLCCFSFFFAFSLSATMVLPLNLEKISRRADKIFVGRCEAVEEDLDENNIPSTFVTYQVLEKIKGEVRDREIFKQFGTARQEIRSSGGIVLSLKSAYRRYGPAVYQPGTDEVLFLYKESRLGFTSPVGWGQGRFRITTLSTGEKGVSNLFQTLFLKEPASLRALKMGGEGKPLKLDHFLSVVKKMVNP